MPLSEIIDETREIPPLTTAPIPVPIKTLNICHHSDQYQ